MMLYTTSGFWTQEKGNNVVISLLEQGQNLNLEIEAQVSIKPALMPNLYEWGQTYSCFCWSLELVSIMRIRLTLSVDQIVLAVRKRRVKRSDHHRILHTPAFSCSDLVLYMKDFKIPIFPGNMYSYAECVKITSKLNFSVSNSRQVSVILYFRCLVLEQMISVTIINACLVLTFYDNLYSFLLQIKYVVSKPSSRNNRIRSPEGFLHCFCFLKIL